MPCFHPLKAWKPPPGREGRGGRMVVFSDPGDPSFTQIDLPCGQCIGCRIERSKQWALRCINEASQHDLNCFLTLTYKDNPISLNVRDIQLFLKRLRKEVGSVRFFQCGEYGTLNDRPHHHVLIFGWRPSDLEVFGRSPAGFIYTSSTLERLWPHGFSTVGDVSFESAAYVARYILKKQTGRNASEHYGGRKPEFITMSRRPGIGQKFFELFARDFMVKDGITYAHGLHARTPRYYDKLFEKHHPEDFLKIKERRIAFVESHPEYFSSDRLSSKEYYLKYKLQSNERKI